VPIKRLLIQKRKGGLCRKLQLSRPVGHLPPRSTSGRAFPPRETRAAGDSWLPATDSKTGVCVTRKELSQCNPWQSFNLHASLTSDTSAHPAFHSSIPTTKLAKTLESITLVTAQATSSRSRVPCHPSQQLPCRQLSPSRIADRRSSSIPSSLHIDPELGICLITNLPSQPFKRPDSDSPAL
jgi:hypothetical protein